MCIDLGKKWEFSKVYYIFVNVIKIVSEEAGDLYDMPPASFVRMIEKI